jgi:hypothetical protein
MDYQELCNQVFSADKRIRYATVTDSQCNILAGGMRHGVASLESSEDAKRIDLQVTILDGVMRTWSESLGRARFALIQHEKAYMVIVPFNNRHVELSIETSMSLEEIGRLVALVEIAARQVVSEREATGERG